MKLSKWAEKQGVSYQTAWRWWKAGKLPIKASQMPSGNVIVQEDEIDNENKRTVISARVSSNDKKDDLIYGARRGQNKAKKIKEIVKDSNE